jgi:hypothetical protein
MTAKKQSQTKPKNKGGRPKWEPTEDEIAQIGKLAALGLDADHMAWFLDKGRSVFFERMKEMPSFADAIKSGRAKADGKALNALWKKIDGGDTACILFYIKTRLGWKEVSVTEHTGKDGAPIQQEHKMSNELINARIAETLGK